MTRRIERILFSLTSQPTLLKPINPIWLSSLVLARKMRHRSRKKKTNTHKDRALLLLLLLRLLRLLPVLMMMITGDDDAISMDQTSICDDQGLEQSKRPKLGRLN